jgi:hypothetical protein
MYHRQKLLDLNYLVNFEVVNLFIKAPVEEVLQVIRNTLSRDPSFPERPLSRFHPMTRENAVSETLCLLNKNMTMDNVQKHKLSLLYCKAIYENS